MKLKSHFILFLPGTSTQKYRTRLRSPQTRSDTFLFARTSMYFVFPAYPYYAFSLRVTQYFPFYKICFLSSARPFMLSAEVMFHGWYIRHISFMAETEWEIFRLEIEHFPVCRFFTNFAERSAVKKKMKYILSYFVAQSIYKTFISARIHLIHPELGAINFSKSDPTHLASSLKHGIWVFLNFQIAADDWR